MPQPVQLADILFPGGTLEVTDLQCDPAQQKVIIIARPADRQPQCPCCHTPSSSLHSHYQRSLTDLPCLGRGVHLQLSVRRFRCREKTCSRHIFCERIDDVAPRSARMTRRLITVLNDMALEIGASAGRRVGQLWGVERSRTIYLRVMRRMTPVQPPAVVKHVGVDDFALKRGSFYGTLIIDLDTGKPIEMLPDRTATTLVTWLKQHPEIEVATRDRSTEYARGLSEGAPQAQQVLDRWHLIKNLREALERQVQRHREDMNSALAVEGEHTVLPLRPSSAERSSQEALERKRVQYAELYSQFQQGKSIAAIVRTADVHRATVHKAIRCQGQVFRRRHADLPASSPPFAKCYRTNGMQAVVTPVNCTVSSFKKDMLDQVAASSSGSRNGVRYRPRRRPAHSEYRQCETARPRQTPKTRLGLPRFRVVEVKRL